MRRACRSPRATSAARRLAALMAIGVAACAVRPAVGPPPAARSAPSDVAAYYDVPGPVPAATLTLRQVREGYEVWRVSLPPRTRPDPRPEDVRPIDLRWYRPLGRAGRRPAVVVSPILGSETAFVDGFAERFAREGWHALLVRRPEVAYDETRGVEQVEEGLRRSVTRQCQAVDWLLERPDVDPTRLGSFGISAGGIQNAMVAGADDRYAAHVIALAGGPLADVFADTREESLRRLFERAMRQTGLGREALRERLRATIRTDPLLLAPHVPRDRVLLVLARFDRTVPARDGERLYEALGRPRTVFLPLGHYTSVLALPFVAGRTVDFLRERLGG